MPSNAALAISGERQFLRRMANGLTAAGGSVQAVESLSEAYPHLPDAFLVYYHALSLPDDNIQKLANILKGEKRLAVLLPRPGIQDMLKPLSLDQVSSVASVGAADGATLAGIASRNLYGNIFGLERYLPYGVRTHAMLIGDYHEKAVAMGTIASFARSMNVRRKYLESIEQVADELLMNALYDAPLVASQLGLIDSSAGLFPTDGSSLHQDRLVLQYACDGETFALGVTDRYGALQKSALIEYVGRCLTSARPLNQETGVGAGLGLYLVCNSVSQLIFNVSPGVATEVIALFDLRAPKVRLTHISFVSESADASRVPALAAGQRRAAAAVNGGTQEASTPLSVKLVLALTVLVLVAAGGVLLWNKLTPDTRGHLIVTTDPPGAQISVDGVARGRSPARGRGLLVANLAARRHTISARKSGYEMHDPVVVTVRAGHRARVTIRLKRLPTALKIFSSPPGAAVQIDGNLRGKTPLVLAALVPGKSYRVSVTKAGYLQEQRTLIAPAPGTTDAQVFELRFSADWGHLWLKTNVPVRHVQIDGQPVKLLLPLRAFRVALGKHTIVLKNRRPYLRHEARFEVVRAGHESWIDLVFGRILPEGKGTRVFWDGRYHEHDILVPVGLYTLQVKSARGEVRQRQVLVLKGKTTRVRP